MELKHGLCFLAVLLIQVLVLEGIKVRQCGSKVAVDSPDIYVSNCKKLPCLLKRNRYTNVSFTITPEEEHPKVINDVFARVLGLPFPFIGVNGTSSCNKFYDTKTGQKVGCPLQPGVTYTYKDRFKILRIYPRLKLLVHWAFRSNGKTIFCFEVPARIV